MRKEIRSSSWSWLAVFLLNLPFYSLGSWPVSLSQAVSVIWPAGGVALVSILIFGRSAAAAVFASALGGHLIRAMQMDVEASHAVLTAGLFVAAAKATTAWLAASAILDFCDGPDVFRSGARFWRFVTIVVVTHAFGAAMIAAWLTFNGLLPVTQAWLATIAGSCSSVSGALILTALVFNWSSARGAAHGGRPIEMLLLWIGFAALVAFALHLVVPGPSKGGFPRSTLILPMLLWIALRCRGRGVTVALVICAALNLPFALHGSAVFPAASPELSVIFFQFYLVVLAVVSLGFVTVLEERDDLQTKSALSLDKQGLANSAPGC